MNEHYLYDAIVRLARIIENQQQVLPCAEIMARRFADSLFAQDKIEVNWSGMSSYDKQFYLTAAMSILNPLSPATDVGTSGVKS